MDNIIVAGYVYFFQSQASLLYKIGFTQQLETRMRALRTSLPKGGMRMYSMYVPDARKAERFFHRLFADKRVNGEWFALTHEDMDEVKLIWSEVDEDSFDVTIFEREGNA